MKYRSDSRSGNNTIKKIVVRRNKRSVNKRKKPKKSIKKRVERIPIQKIDKVYHVKKTLKKQKKKKKTLKKMKGGADDTGAGVAATTDADVRYPDDTGAGDAATTDAGELPQISTPPVITDPKELDYKVGDKVMYYDKSNDEWKQATIKSIQASPTGIDPTIEYGGKIRATILDRIMSIKSYKESMQDEPETGSIKVGDIVRINQGSAEDDPKTYGVVTSIDVDNNYTVNKITEGSLKARSLRMYDSIVDSGITEKYLTEFMEKIEYMPNDKTDIYDNDKPSNNGNKKLLLWGMFDRWDKLVMVEGGAYFIEYQSNERIKIFLNDKLKSNCTYRDIDSDFFTNLYNSLTKKDAQNIVRKLIQSKNKDFTFDISQIVKKTNKEEYYIIVKKLSSGVYVLYRIPSIFYSHDMQDLTPKEQNKSIKEYYGQKKYNELITQHAKEDKIDEIIKREMAKGTEMGETDMNQEIYAERYEELMREDPEKLDATLQGLSDVSVDTEDTSVKMIKKIDYLLYNMVEPINCIENIEKYGGNFRNIIEDDMEKSIELCSGYLLQSISTKQSKIWADSIKMSLSYRNKIMDSDQYLKFPDGEGKVVGLRGVAKKSFTDLFKEKIKGYNLEFIRLATIVHKIIIKNENKNDDILSCEDADIGNALKTFINIYRNTEVSIDHSTARPDEMAVSKLVPSLEPQYKVTDTTFGMDQTGIIYKGFGKRLATVPGNRTDLTKVETFLYNQVFNQITSKKVLIPTDYTILNDSLNNELMIKPPINECGTYLYAGKDIIYGVPTKIELNIDNPTSEKEVLLIKTFMIENIEKPDHEYVLYKTSVNIAYDGLDIKVQDIESVNENKKSDILKNIYKLLKKESTTNIYIRYSLLKGNYLLNTPFNEDYGDINRFMNYGGLIGPNKKVGKKYCIPYLKEEGEIKMRRDPNTFTYNTDGVFLKDGTIIDSNHLSHNVRGNITPLFKISEPCTFNEYLGNILTDQLICGTQNPNNDGLGILDQKESLELKLQMIKETGERGSDNMNIKLDEINKHDPYIFNIFDDKLLEDYLELTLHGYLTNQRSLIGLLIDEIFPPFNFKLSENITVSAGNKNDQRKIIKDDIWTNMLELINYAEFQMLRKQENKSDILDDFEKIRREGLIFASEKIKPSKIINIFRTLEEISQTSGEIKNDVFNIQYKEYPERGNSIRRALKSRLVVSTWLENSYGIPISHLDGNEIFWTGDTGKYLDYLRRATWDEIIKDLQSHIPIIKPMNETQFIAYIKDNIGISVMNSTNICTYKLSEKTITKEFQGGGLEKIIKAIYKIYYKLILENNKARPDGTPLELPEGWVTEVSRSTGKTYYRNLMDQDDKQFEVPTEPVEMYFRDKLLKEVVELNNLPQSEDVNITLKHIHAWYDLEIIKQYVQFAYKLSDLRLYQFIKNYLKFMHIDDGRNETINEMTREGDVFKYLTRISAFHNYFENNISTSLRSRKSNGLKRIKLENPTDIYISIGSKMKTQNIEGGIDEEHNKYFETLPPTEINYNNKEVIVIEVDTTKRDGKYILIHFYGLPKINDNIEIDSDIIILGLRDTSLNYSIGKVVGEKYDKDGATRITVDIPERKGVKPRVENVSNLCAKWIRIDQLKVKDTSWDRKYFMNTDNSLIKAAQDHLDMKINNTVKSEIDNYMLEQNKSLKGLIEYTETLFNTKNNLYFGEDNIKIILESNKSNRDNDYIDKLFEKYKDLLEIMPLNSQFRRITKLNEIRETTRVDMIGVKGVTTISNQYYYTAHLNETETTKSINYKSVVVPHKSGEKGGTRIIFEGEREDNNNNKIHFILIIIKILEISLNVVKKDSDKGLQSKLNIYLEYIIKDVINLRNLVIEAGGNKKDEKVLLSETNNTMNHYLYRGDFTTDIADSIMDNLLKIKGSLNAEKSLEREEDKYLRDLNYNFNDEMIETIKRNIREMATINERSNNDSLEKKNDNIVLYIPVVFSSDISENMEEISGIKAFTENEYKASDMLKEASLHSSEKITLTMSFSESGVYKKSKENPLYSKYQQMFHDKEAHKQILIYKQIENTDKVQKINSFKKREIIAENLFNRVGKIKKMRDDTGGVSTADTGGLKPDYKLNYIIGHIITTQNEGTLDDILKSELVLYSKDSVEERLAELILAEKSGELLEGLVEMGVKALESKAREVGVSDEKIKEVKNRGHGHYNLIDMKNHKIVRKTSLKGYYLTELSIEYGDGEKYELRFESSPFDEYENFLDVDIPDDQEHTSMRKFLDDDIPNNLWKYQKLYEKTDQRNATIKLMSKGDISKIISTIKDEGLSIKRLIEEAITPELIPCVVTTTDGNTYFTFLDKSEINLKSNKYIIDNWPCIFFNAAIQYLKPIVIENNDYLLEINGEDFVLKRYDKLYEKTYLTEYEYFDSSEQCKNVMHKEKSLMHLLLKNKNDNIIFTDKSIQTLNNAYANIDKKELRKIGRVAYKPLENKKCNLKIITSSINQEESPINEDLYQTVELSLNTLIKKHEEVSENIIKYNTFSDLDIDETYFKDLKELYNLINVKNMEYISDTRESDIKNNLTEEESTLLDEIMDGYSEMKDIQEIKQYIIKILTDRYEELTDSEESLEKYPELFDKSRFDIVPECKNNIESLKYPRSYENIINSNIDKLEENFNFKNKMIRAIKLETEFKGLIKQIEDRHSIHGYSVSVIDPDFDRCISIVIDEINEKIIKQPDDKESKKKIIASIAKAHNNTTIEDTREMEKHNIIEPLINMLLQFPLGMKMKGKRSQLIPIITQLLRRPNAQQQQQQQTKNILEKDKIFKDKLMAIIRSLNNIIVDRKILERLRRDKQITDRHSILELIVFFNTEGGEDWSVINGEYIGYIDEKMYDINEEKLDTSDIEETLQRININKHIEFLQTKDLGRILLRDYFSDHVIIKQVIGLRDQEGMSVDERIKAIIMEETLYGKGPYKNTYRSFTNLEEINEGIPHFLNLKQMFIINSIYFIQHIYENLNPREISEETINSIIREDIITDIFILCCAYFKKCEGLSVEQDSPINLAEYITTIETELNRNIDLNKWGEPTSKVLNQIRVLYTDYITKKAEKIITENSDLAVFNEEVSIPLIIHWYKYNELLKKMVEYDHRQFDFISTSNARESQYVEMYKKFKNSTDLEESSTQIYDLKKEGFFITYRGIMHILSIITRELELFVERRASYLSIKYQNVVYIKEILKGPSRISLNIQNLKILIKSSFHPQNIYSMMIRGLTLSSLFIYLLAKISIDFDNFEIDNGLIESLTGNRKKESETSRKDIVDNTIYLEYLSEMYDYYKYYYVDRFYLSKFNPIKREIIMKNAMENVGKEKKVEQNEKKPAQKYNSSSNEDIFMKEKMEAIQSSFKGFIRKEQIIKKMPLFSMRSLQDDGNSVLREGTLVNIKQEDSNITGIIISRKERNKYVVGYTDHADEEISSEYTRDKLNRITIVDEYNGINKHINRAYYTALLDWCKLFDNSYKGKLEEIYKKNNFIDGEKCVKIDDDMKSMCLENSLDIDYFKRSDFERQYLRFKPQVFKEIEDCEILYLESLAENMNMKIHKTQIDSLLYQIQIYKKDYGIIFTERNIFADAMNAYRYNMEYNRMLQNIMIYVEDIIYTNMQYIYDIYINHDTNMEMISLEYLNGECFDKIYDIIHLSFSNYEEIIVPNKTINNNTYSKYINEIKSYIVSNPTEKLKCINFYSMKYTTELIEYIDDYILRESKDNGNINYHNDEISENLLSFKKYITYIVDHFNSLNLDSNKNKLPLEIPSENSETIKDIQEKIRNHKVKKGVDPIVRYNDLTEYFHLGVHRSIQTFRPEPILDSRAETDLLMDDYKLFNTSSRNKLVNNIKRLNITTIHDKDKDRVMEQVREIESQIKNIEDSSDTDQATRSTAISNLKQEITGLNDKYKTDKIKSIPILAELSDETITGGDTEINNLVRLINLTNEDFIKNFNVIIYNNIVLYFILKKGGEHIPDYYSHAKCILKKMDTRNHVVPPELLDPESKSMIKMINFYKSSNTNGDYVIEDIINLVFTKSPQNKKDGGIEKQTFMGTFGSWGSILEDSTDSTDQSYVSELYYQYLTGSETNPNNYMKQYIDYFIENEKKILIENSLEDILNRVEDYLISSDLGGKTEISYFEMILENYSNYDEGLFDAIEQPMGFDMRYMIIYVAKKYRDRNGGWGSICFSKSDIISSYNQLRTEIRERNYTPLTPEDMIHFITSRKIFFIILSFEVTYLTESLIKTLNKGIGLPIVGKEVSEKELRGNPVSSIKSFKNTLIQYNEKYESNIEWLQNINKGINIDRDEISRFEIHSKGEGEGFDTLKTDMFTYASKYFISLFEIGLDNYDIYRGEDKNVFTMSKNKLEEKKMDEGISEEEDNNISQIKLKNGLLYIEGIIKKIESNSPDRDKIIYSLDNILAEKSCLKTLRESMIYNISMPKILKQLKILIHKLVCLKDYYDIKENTGDKLEEKKRNRESMNNIGCFDNMNVDQITVDSIRKKFDEQREIIDQALTELNKIISDTGNRINTNIVSINSYKKEARKILYSRWVKTDDSEQDYEWVNNRNVYEETGGNILIHCSRLLIDEKDQMIMQMGLSSRDSKLHDFNRVIKLDELHINEKSRELFDDNKKTTWVKKSCTSIDMNGNTIRQNMYSTSDKRNTLNYTESDLEGKEKEELSQEYIDKIDNMRDDDMKALREVAEKLGIEMQADETPRSIKAKIKEGQRNLNFLNKDYEQRLNYDSNHYIINYDDEKDREKIDKKINELVQKCSTFMPNPDISGMGALGKSKLETVVTSLGRHKYGHHRLDKIDQTSSETQRDSSTLEGTTYRGEVPSYQLPTISSDAKAKPQIKRSVSFASVGTGPSPAPAPSTAPVPSPAPEPAPAPAPVPAPAAMPETDTGGSRSSIDFVRDLMNLTSEELSGMSGIFKQLDVEALSKIQKYIKNPDIKDQRIMNMNLTEIDTKLNELVTSRALHQYEGDTMLTRQDDRVHLLGNIRMIYLRVLLNGNTELKELAEYHSNGQETMSRINTILRSEPDHVKKFWSK